MAKLSKPISWLAPVFGWLSGIYSSAVAAFMTAAIATIFFVLTDCIKWLESPYAHTIILVFVAILWTYIGFVWLRTRRSPLEIFPKRDVQYGITFEGVSALFDARHEENGLQLSVGVRNYLPTPLKYKVEFFELRIETRSMKTENAETIFLSRGAGRAYNGPNFKVSHIQEFYGRRPEGKLDFSILYGDVEQNFSRRLKMSFKTYFVFPEAHTIASTPPNFPIPIGFNSTIEKESDEPL